MYMLRTVLLKCTVALRYVYVLVLFTLFSWQCLAYRADLRLQYQVFLPYMYFFGFYPSFPCLMFGATYIYWLQQISLEFYYMNYSVTHLSR